MEMEAHSSPLVSIVTPVYNNCKYIPDCIESILTQSYQNWEYTIVDNCSTDGSADVAERYAKTNSRITVCRNHEFLAAVANHNRALRKVSVRSKYCKLVFADDWLFPRCLEEMVAVGEKYPSVGIIGAYGLQGNEVSWTGLPYSSSPIPGHSVCRRLFLNRTCVFGTSTSVLYRTEVVKNQDPFYNESNFHADMEVCIQLLKKWDFGFVHQVLTFSRPRPESLSTFTNNMNTIIGGYLLALVRHGRAFLTAEEYDECFRGLVSEYYKFLAVSLIKGQRDKKFWGYHKRTLAKAGVSFRRTWLARGLATRMARAVLNPSETIEKLLAGWGNASERSQATTPNEERAV